MTLKLCPDTQGGAQRGRGAAVAPGASGGVCRRAAGEALGFRVKVWVAELQVSAAAALKMNRLEQDCDDLVHQ